ncbi:Uncharacterised protein [Mycobacterium tuberculosis]|nr:Uncharacterised protein [Mycobacterium tuberculosis]
MTPLYSPSTSAREPVRSSTSRRIDATVPSLVTSSSSFRTTSGWIAPRSPPSRAPARTSALAASVASRWVRIPPGSLRAPPSSAIERRRSFCSASTSRCVGSTVFSWNCRLCSSWWASP